MKTINRISAVCLIAIGLFFSTARAGQVTMGDWDFTGIPCFTNTTCEWEFTVIPGPSVIILDTICWSWGQFDIIYEGGGLMSVTLTNCNIGGTDGADFDLNVPDDIFNHYLPEVIVEMPTTFCSYCGPTEEPDLQLSDDGYDFGQVYIGETADWVFTISNIGDADLEVTSITSDDTAFTTDFTNPRLTIPPGESTPVTVTFEPLAEQPYGTDLTIVSNDPDGDQYVTLAGTGILLLEPDINLPAGTHDFGLVPTGDVVYWNMVVENNGTSLLTVTDITADDNAFAVVFTDPLEIADGTSETVIVSFAPTMVQAYSGNLTITSDDPDENPLLVPLQGTGEGDLLQHFTPVAPTGSPYALIIDSATLDGSSLLQGDEIAVFDGTLCVGAIFSTGVWPLYLTAWEGDSEQGFPGFTPGAVITWIVWSNAADAEAEADALYIIGDGTFGYGNSSEVELTAALTAPDIELNVVSYGFGDIYIGETETLDLVISNVGDADLTVSDITSDEAVFTTDFGDPREVIIPGGSLSVTVTFAPLAEQSYSGTLTISSDDPDDPVVTVALDGTGIPVPLPDIELSASAYDFEQVYLGDTASWDLIINNVGDADLNIVDVYTDDPVFTTDFDLARVVIIPGGSLTVAVTFAPDAVQIYSGLLIISCNDPDEPAVTVDLAGEGVPAPVPDINLSAYTHDFGQVLVGQSSNWNLIIHNVGDADLELLDIVGDNPVFTTDFDLTREIIIPGGSLTVAVTFAPDAEQAYNGTLMITSNDPDESIVGVALMGEGTAVPVPDIDLSATIYDFGQVYVGATGSWDLVISNVGSADLEVSDISSDEAVFTTDFETTRLAIPAGETVTVAVTFAPMLVQSYSGILSIYSNDPDEPTLTVELAGEGMPLPAPDIELSATSYDYGTVYVGTSDTWDMVISNVGNADLEVTGISSDEPAFTTPYFDDLRAVIPPGETITVEVLFSPELVQLYNGTLTISSDDPDEPERLVSLTGEGSPALEPDIDLSATVHDFGQLAVGEVLNWELTVYNLGDADLDVTDLSSDEPAFTAAFATREIIIPGGSAQLTVSFAPTEVVLYAGTLSISSNDPDESVMTVDLAGEGIPATAPDIDLSATAWDFGAVLIDETADWELVISNLGDADLDISEITSDEPAFTAAFALRTVIPPGGYETVIVTFSPTEGIEYNGTLSILSDDPDESVVTVALTGSGDETNYPPTLELPDSFTFAEDELLVVDFSLYADDINGDELLLTTESGVNIHAAIAGLQVTFTADPDWNGSETFTFTVDDQSRETASDEVLVIVEPVNDAPVLELPDSFTFEEDGSLLLDINDWADDVDGDDLLLYTTGGVNIDTQLDGMMVTLTAEENWYGEETLTFLVSDGRARDLDSDEVLVIVTPVNDSPVIDLPNLFLFDEDASLVEDFAPYLDDIDGDEYTLDYAGGDAIQVEITGFTVTFTADLNWHGSETITFSVDDMQGRLIAYDYVLVAVSSVNDPPTLELPVSLSFLEDSELVVDFGEYATDVDGDQMLLSTDDGVNIHTVIIGMQATFTADPGWFGEETFTFTVDDQHGETVSDQLLVIVESVPEPELFIDIATHDFGLVEVGDAPEWQLEIANNGDGDLELTAVISDEAAFTTDFPGTLIIAPEGSAQVTVTFTPLAEATYSGTLTIASNDAGGDAFVTLNGEGWQADPPLPFSLLAPANGAEVELPLTCSWEATTDPDPGDVITYYLYLFGDEALSDTLLTVEVDGTSYQLEELPAAASYWWHVLALDTNSGGTLSDETWSFDWLDVVGTIYNGIPVQFSIATLYPNPFNPEVTVVYGVPQPAYVSAAIYDMSGRLVTHIDPGFVQPGYQTFTWRPTGATGIYFLQMSSDSGWRETQRLIYLK
ncbi:MAG: choice-of-anchor D domain-containing protein [Candidatus Delongbacteria bacterium]|nr:choice-of-anchor D domain-containing protein [Candidatus Delongbacteria bacterium]